MASLSLLDTFESVRELWWYVGMCFELVLEKELEVLSVHNCDISLYEDTVGTPALDATSPRAHANSVHATANNPSPIDSSIICC